MTVKLEIMYQQANNSKDTVAEGSQNLIPANGMESCPWHSVRISLVTETVSALREPKQWSLDPDNP